ncbi:hypothetical protein P691DRAFT_549555 [Macrolepiota fuliginosa MF-IS2]|uniref:Uncharacterized protein n=1 Tax=Macrolepiota fuliginosa MF-IS2 TaxID=1400762 RepID=A0A9P5XFX8_9AGAR|nr:hypothetical protein P691DRAFT_549555 [Macrolepiota fuliginosa MF-IS2]
MKDWYSNASGSRSPPFRTDLLRLYTSVSDLANRYQPPSLTPTSSPRPLPSTSTRSDAGSPANRELRERQRNSLEGTEDKAHWRRIEELAELGFRAKERELREREQEINMRERELDRDRARLLALREGRPGSSSASASVSANSSEQGGHDLATPQASQLQPRPRERRISLRR